MKKSLLLASMAVLGLSAAAQGVDPASYASKEGYELHNVWLMSYGDGTNGVAVNDWLALPFDDFGKATSATIFDGKVIVACNQTYVDAVDENGQPYQSLSQADHHLVVLDAATGKFLSKVNLTIDGVPHGDLLQSNCIGHDDFGHLWITNYVSNTYNEADGTAVVKPIKLWSVDYNTGAMTLVNEFALNEEEGPGNGARIDFCDVIGDITGQEARAVFMACPNEIASTYAWHLNQGETEWKPGNEDDGFIVVPAFETDPQGQTAWNYSPGVSIVRDADFSGAYYYVDGHPTRPVLYDNAGEMIDNVGQHDADEAWAGFIPALQPNGVLQFGLGNTQFLAWSLAFPDDTNYGGHIAVAKLDDSESLENAVPMWIFPEATLGLKKNGRFWESISVTPEYEDANGKKAIDIMIYKDCDGVGVYRLCEEGFEAAGVNDLVVENNNAPVEYFNLNGVRVNQKDLAPGLYITRQGGKANKVIVK